MEGRAERLRNEREGSVSVQPLQPKAERCRIGMDMYDVTDQLEAKEDRTGTLPAALTASLIEEQRLVLGELTQLRAHDRIPAAPPQDAVVFRGANAAEAASKAFPWISTSFNLSKIH